MRDFNLAVKYLLEGSREQEVKEATRIELGRGGMLLYSPEGGRMEHLDLHAIRQLSIQKICRPSSAAVVPVVV